MIFPFFFTFLCDLNFLHENNSLESEQATYIGERRKEEDGPVPAMKEKARGLAYIRRASTLQESRERNLPQARPRSLPG